MGRQELVRIGYFTTAGCLPVLSWLRVKADREER